MAENLPVKIIGIASGETEGTLGVLTFNPQQRLMRALGAGAGCLLLAVLAVFLPVIHFVQVPLFILLSPFAAFHFYRKTVRVIAGSVPCPACKQPFAPEPGAGSWPLKEICPHCRSQAKILPITQA